MTSQTENQLRWRLLWQGLSWLGLGIVIILSLLPSPYLPPSPISWDKAQHTLAYAFLMLWFWQAFPRSWHWPLLLFCVGCMLELLQANTSYRFGDWADILANTFGVMLGMLLVLYTPLGRLLLGVEQIFKYWSKA